jgi:N-acetylmuramoyl-L-alanine amidase
MNTFSDPQYFGTQVFYAASGGSKQLADYIQTEVCSEDPDNTRVAKDGSKNIFILSETDIPSVVVECGFLSNEKDLTRLKSDEYQSQLAGAIFNGITKYFS